MKISIIANTNTGVYVRLSYMYMYMSGMLYMYMYLSSFCTLNEHLTYILSNCPNIQAVSFIPRHPQQYFWLLFFPLLFGGGGGGQTIKTNILKLYLVQNEAKMCLMYCTLDTTYYMYMYMYMYMYTVHVYMYTI